MAGGKGRRGGVDDLRERRQAQLAEVAEIWEASNKALTDLRKALAQCELLLSVADGLYEEVDKVSKKSPAEAVTTLVLEEVNHLVSEVKQLGKDDPFIQRLKEFVPAGEAPEHRDAVVVLKLVRQGLVRVRGSLTTGIAREVARSREAALVRHALEFYLEYAQVPNRDDLRDMGAPLDAEESWIGGYPDRLFDFARLDRMNLRTYLARNLSSNSDEE